jgi:hypothetical protein
VNTFEATIRKLTRPLEGQYPRPWMTKLADPTSARVFIVGKNQAKGYPVERVGSHDLYVDALFNRNVQSTRTLYDRVTGGQPSPTRLNIDGLTTRLEGVGVPEVLETNVICYSTPLSSHLSLPVHRRGRERGQEIFRTLLHFIRPSVLIVHGSDATRELAKVLGAMLPEPPDSSSKIKSKGTDNGMVFVLPSLAPPAYNKWSPWAQDYLDRIASAVARTVKTL